jgi:hypothetical protein
MDLTTTTLVHVFHTALYPVKWVCDLAACAGEVDPLSLLDRTESGCGLVDLLASIRT